MSRKSS